MGFSINPYENGHIIQLPKQYLEISFVGKLLLHAFCTGCLAQERFISIYLCNSRISQLPLSLLGSIFAVEGLIFCLYVCWYGCGMLKVVQCCLLSMLCIYFYRFYHLSCILGCHIYSIFLSSVVLFSFVFLISFDSISLYYKLLTKQVAQFLYYQ